MSNVIRVVSYAGSFNAELGFQANISDTIFLLIIGAALI